jgi:sugar lactone lactonase YvrE
VLRIEFQRVLTAGRSRADALNNPSAVCFDAAHEELYVLDDGNRRIVIYDRDGGYVGQIRWKADRLFPTGLTVDDQGTLYLVNGQPAILACDYRGRVLDEWPVKYPEGETRERPSLNRVLAGPQGQLYLLDTVNKRIVVVDSQTGELRREFGGSGSEFGRFQSLNDLALGPDGRIYGCDMTTSYVTAFDPDGRALRRIGEPGGNPGSLALPTGVTVDRDNHIFVVDCTRHALLAYDRNGRRYPIQGRGDRLLEEYGGLGKSAGWFYFPKFVGTDSLGRIYVVEPFLNRVQVFAVHVSRR